MTQRISENQLSRSLANRVLKNRLDIAKYSNEVTTGIKAGLPGDTPKPATISQFQNSLGRIEGYNRVVASTKSFLQFQDQTVQAGSDLMARAKELATQGANETLTASERSQISVEVLEIRNSMVQLANSTYQGKYVWNGTRTDSPPYNALTYAAPVAAGQSKDRYFFDNTLPGATAEQTVGVADSLEIRTNTDADDVWTGSINALERLGRALAGFDTLPAPPGQPDGTGVQYVFPTDYTTQTQAIRSSIDLITTATESNLQIERVSLGGRLERLETADSLLLLGKDTAQQVISQLQEADIAESGTNLTLAQNALEASLTVTQRILRLTVLDYI